MDPLRKAIARYAAWLDARAARYERHSRILTAVAHRLRHILADTEPDTETQYGTEHDGVIRVTETLEGLPKGTTLYTRKASYTPWKRIN